MATPMEPTERQLRVIQLLCWAPGFALPLASSIETGQAYFAFLLIPISISALHGIALLTNRAKPHGVLDLAFAVVIMGMLIPYWIVMAASMGWWYGGPRLAMLTSYGSAPPSVTFCIHTYLALRAFIASPQTFFTSVFACSTCPHCQREIRPTAISRIDPRLLWDLSPHGSKSGSSVHSHETKKGYVSVSADDVCEAGPAETDEEGTPRASTDDETARLV